MPEGENKTAEVNKLKDLEVIANGSKVEKAERAAIIAKKREDFVKKEEAKAASLSYLFGSIALGGVILMIGMIMGVIYIATRKKARKVKKKMFIADDPNLEKGNGDVKNDKGKGKDKFKDKDKDKNKDKDKLKQDTEKDKENIAEFLPKPEPADVSEITQSMDEKSIAEPNPLVAIPVDLEMPKRDKKDKKDKGKNKSRPNLQQNKSQGFNKAMMANKSKMAANQSKIA